MRLILSMLVSFLLGAIKFLIVLKRFIAAFFVIAIYRPGRLILRFIFYKIVIRAYLWHLALIRKLGWSKSRGQGISFLFKDKAIHTVVLILTVVIVGLNITTKTKATTIQEDIGKTIIASLIESEFGSIEENQLIEEFFDEEAVISATQQRYLDNLMNLEPQPRAQMAAPAEEEEIASVSRGGAALVKPDMASTKISKRPRTETAMYVIKPGDTVSTIAQEFEVSVNTILWENDLSAYSIIRPGNEIRILPMTGLSHKAAKNDTLSAIAKQYQVEEADIISANNLADSSRLSVGQILLIPGGKKETYAKYTPTTYSGLSAISSLVKPGSASPVSGNKMNWPTDGYRITQYYSWRHLAVDIANKLGTPIYAADAGTIESLGWGKGYGNQIIVNHGGGKKTRYAHLSKFYAKQGQAVSKGETIGAMGSTGWSTGSHLHFEVIINGAKYNPLNYIK